MKIGRYALSALAVALLAVVGGALLILSHEPPEPSYGGRTLGQWVEAYYRYPSSVNARSWIDQPPAVAVNGIGTNAIPYLLRWIKYDRPTWKTKWYPRLTALLKRLRVNWPPEDKQEQRAKGVQWAFGVLGQQAAGAAGELTRLLHDAKAQEVKNRAARGLSCIGQRGVPPLLAALTNKQTTIRLAALDGLLGLGGTTNNSTDWPSGRGTTFQTVAPALIQCLNERDDRLTLGALKALGWVRDPPDYLIPLATDCLQSTNYDTQCRAAMLLMHFGAKARPAVPALLTLLTNPVTRVCGKIALQDIDRQALENAIHP